MPGVEMAARTYTLRVYIRGEKVLFNQNTLSLWHFILHTMFIHKLKPVLLTRQSLVNRCLFGAAVRSPVLHRLSATRCLHVQSHITIPDIKEADAIVPLLQQIEIDTPPSASTYNGILATLALEGRSEQAQKLYDVIFRNHDVKADIDTYSQLMLAYMNDGKYEEAMEIYYELRDHDKDPKKNLRL